MKKIIGLDLGTTSIGWALVEEADDYKTSSCIIDAGSRVTPLTTVEITDFSKINAETVNMQRTQKRGARRTLSRYKQRRKALKQILEKHAIIKSDFSISLMDKNPRAIWEIRAHAANEKISLEDFARVLFAINKKRGYKSNRKANDTTGEGVAIDGMELAKKLYEENLTPGQLVYQRLLNGKRYIPSFYRSDLKQEFNKIWDEQKKYYPREITDELYLQLEGKNKTETGKLFRVKLELQGYKQKGSRDEKNIELYTWRKDALHKKIELEQLDLVLSAINGQIASSSGYLGEISDRSKQLLINKITVGQYLFSHSQSSIHNPLKKQIFYRQDYLDEFEKLWETQASYYPHLTNDLKEEIRDLVIFYQRRLKSKKGEISICEFMGKEIMVDGKKRIIGPKVIPKSSPLFEYFRMWQTLNNLSLKSKEDNSEFYIEVEQKQMLVDKLLLSEELSVSNICKILTLQPSEWLCSFSEIKGSNTIYKILSKLNEILSYEALEIPLEKLGFEEAIKQMKPRLAQLGIKPDIIDWNFSILNEDDFEKQIAYQFYHLLYSAEENVHIKKTLVTKYGFSEEYASLVAQIALEDDYGSLSSRAIKKILPHLTEGLEFSEACKYAEINHSHSEDVEARKNKKYLEKLEILPKNSLRNPVVEKILNQMVHVVNAIIEKYGKPDEIRVELARELKQTAEQRNKASQSIAKNTSENQRIVDILKTEFGLPRVSRNDIIRYRLYQELKDNGYKTLYTNTAIHKEDIFSNKFDIEHIIPKSRVFDDSFSNKTLTLASINKDKGNDTALDYIENKRNEDLDQYRQRCWYLLNKGQISKTKYDKLMMRGEKIPNDFLARDLGNTAYIAKKALSMLNQLVPLTTATTGSITKKLREDWGVIEVLKELNWPKYKVVGMVEYIEGKNGKTLERIKDWNKRNDHRHHAMDAIAVAFTKPAIVQYLNNLNAKSNKDSAIYGIEQKHFYRNDKGKLVAKAPIHHMRQACLEVLDSILISHKAKNKVVTPNKNYIKGKNKQRVKQPQITLTPRGALHKETIYGQSYKPEVRMEKVGTSFTLEKINLVSSPKYREALLQRLMEFDGDPKKAFVGKNSLKKNPLYCDDQKLYKVPDVVKIVELKPQFTIRKPISPELKIEKVVDSKIKEILQNRLKECDGDAKKAFGNLEEKPIWLNEENGIAIKSVKITGVTNAVPIHYKKDHFGQAIERENESIPSSWVSGGNNHHVAIYKNAEGKMEEEVVSFFEAVTRIQQKQPLINKHKEGYEFMFTLKQNEMFVFPNEGFGFNPAEIDLLDPKNASAISPHLFRVQKIATNNYMFTHHLETQATNNEDLKTKKELRGIKYNHVRTPEGLNNIIKVRLNHLGNIVHIGEY